MEFRKFKLSEYSDEEVDVAVNAHVLRGLEDELLANPDTFGRPVVRSVLHSLAKYEFYDRAEDWRTIANRIPHVADTLGRYLRGAMETDWTGSEVTKCVEWFAAYEKSIWGQQHWVTSQFALAFDEETSPRIREVLDRWLMSSTDLQQVAIAAQRMSVMDRTYARNGMRSRADNTSDPLLLRVFALGLLQAGADRRTVMAVLERDDRNRLLTRYLDLRAWEAPPVNDDFSGSGQEKEAGGPTA
ncbi:hypothetical protein LT350_25495 [Mycolicibacterium smegmatis]|uniref:hypothetical protein n=1 Tax=Mycolicibacterium smegmatis TaxID=1772 RepID=UPI001E49FA73|nr:hypothetical protein [Mycolicibacterium smegmatis]UGU29878.1 hypothetical protein LT350_25495 [Mycolicibacterium smegmatis]ULN70815.1 hypothetical protein KZ782_02305 [Mycolicibacterium smegmatis]